MSLLRTLLVKDLRRARRNPIPWLIQLAVPLFITAIIGLVFGPKSNPSGLGRIKLAFVDEDQSWLSQVIRDSLGRQQEQINIQLQLVDRSEALRLVSANKSSAAVMMPAGFADDFLEGKPVKFELVKNPAQSVQPTVVEELMRLLTSGLSVVQRTVGPDLKTWRAGLENTDGFDIWTAAVLLMETTGRLKPAREYLVPPLVGFTETTVAAVPTGKAGPKFHLFAFVLLGLVGMFLLYIADLAVRDLYREVTGRTLARFRTVHHSLLLFVSAKVVFAVTMVVLGALILLGGGMVIFGFAWHRIPEMSVVVAAYAVFAAGFMALIAGLAGSERRAGMFNNILVTGLALGSGCMFPLDLLGPFWRDQVAPWLPTYWYLETTRRMQYWTDDPGWIAPALQLLVAGIICVLLASWLFRRKLERGVQA